MSAQRVDKSTHDDAEELLLLLAERVQRGQLLLQLLLLGHIARRFLERREETNNLPK